MLKKVFVIIITYNGETWIEKNITSLLNSSYPLKIIVIDNNSSDNTLSIVEKYSEVDLIKSEINHGFGKANNIGIETAMKAGADYMFLLNQDAWVFNDTIKNLIKCMEFYPELGIVSPMHYSGNEVDLDENFMRYFNKSKTFTKENNLYITQFVNAAAWMVSRTCMERTGMFAPIFNHYGEDRNYCDRVIYHEYIISIDTKSKIIHDRIISRNFNKDIIQSQYKILCTLLNINRGLLKSFFLASREVIGLPKYFIKYYGYVKSAKLLFSLVIYYLEKVYNIKTIKSIRDKSK